MQSSLLLLHSYRLCTSGFGHRSLYPGSALSAPHPVACVQTAAERPFQQTYVSQSSGLMHQFSSVALLETQISPIGALINTLSDTHFLPVRGLTVFLTLFRFGFIHFTMAHFPFPLSQVHRSWWGWTGKLSHTLPLLFLRYSIKTQLLHKAGFIFPTFNQKKKQKEKETSWLKEIATAANFHLTKTTQHQLCEVAFVTGITLNRKPDIHPCSKKNLRNIVTARVCAHPASLTLISMFNTKFNALTVSMCAVRLSATRTLCFSEDHRRLRRGPCRKSWPGSRQRQDATCCPSLERHSLPLHRGMCSSQ